MRKLIDLEDPFFAPLWIRVSVVLVCVAWGAFEISAGSPLWGVVFIGIGVVCGWRFSTINYDATPED